MAVTDDYTPDELLRMSDEDFSDLVADDARGDVVDALRDEAVLDRWWEAMTVLYNSILGQLAQRKGERDAETRHWRHAAMRFQSGLMGRLAECKGLRRDRNIRDHEAKNVGNRAEKKAAKAARDAITQEAISLLIKAHPEEFARYKAELQASGDTSPPAEAGEPRV